MSVAAHVPPVSPSSAPPPLSSPNPWPQVVRKDASAYRIGPPEPETTWHYRRVKHSGQPPKLTEALSDEFCQYLTEGNYIETAAALCGVARASVYNWLKQGARDRRLERDTPEHRFRLAVDDARAVADANDVAVIYQAARNCDWRAAA